jgi:hypothetical protein
VNFRNPWIDPRIERVRLDGLRSYLEHHGWQSLGPASNPALLRYERVAEAEVGPTLFVPVQLDRGPALQWVIEMVGELALYEKRWAVEVLQDILTEVENTDRVNGTPTAART